MLVCFLVALGLPALLFALGLTGGVAVGLLFVFVVISRVNVVLLFVVPVGVTRLVCGGYRIGLRETTTYWELLSYPTPWGESH